MKDKEYLPHRYKITRSTKRVPHPTQPTPQPDKDIDIETHPEEVVVNPIDPVVPVDTVVEPVKQERIDMDQQRMNQAAREMIMRGEYNHLINANADVDNGRGQGNGNRKRQDRDDRNDRNDRNYMSLRYSVPTFDGKGDAMPHTHLKEFEDFLVNTGSEINDLPQLEEPQPVDRAHYEGVIKDVVSKFKASLKGKPRLWFKMQYLTVNDEPKTVQVYKQILSLFTPEHNL